MNQRYGLPFGGASIDLPAVVRALHDFLATHAVALAKDQDELMRGSGSPALEEYRQERAKLARLDRLEREGQLVPRDESREALARIATILGGAGDALGRQFGPGAVELLHEALDDAQREIERVFGEGTDGLPGDVNGHGAGHEGDDQDGQAPHAG